MSRSYKHTPIIGHTKVKSEKQDKQLYNRKYRRICKVHTHCENYDYPQFTEIAPIYCYSKDGKQWLNVHAMVKIWKRQENFYITHNYNNKYEEVSYLKLWYKLMGK